MTSRGQYVRNIVPIPSDFVSAFDNTDLKTLSASSDSNAPLSQTITLSQTESKLSNAEKQHEIKQCKNFEISSLKF